jgi:hypothetical protein
LGFCSALSRLFESQDWEDVLEDPYLLINSAFESWYEVVDNIVWGILDRVRDAEMVSAFHKERFIKTNSARQKAFDNSRNLDAESSHFLTIDYNHVHTIATDAIHLAEGLDASLRSLECAIRNHSESHQTNSPIWKATHDAFLHRREMFWSTRLRITSIEQRLSNVINLVCSPCAKCEAANHIV